MLFDAIHNRVLVVAGEPQEGPLHLPPTGATDLVVRRFLRCALLSTALDEGALSHNAKKPGPSREEPGSLETVARRIKA
jgi:hypothetical protein